jgi:hypothetical protein
MFIKIVQRSLAWRAPPAAHSLINFVNELNVKKVQDCSRIFTEYASCNRFESPLSALRDMRAIAIVACFSHVLPIEKHPLWIFLSRRKQSLGGLLRTNMYHQKKSVCRTLSPYLKSRHCIFFPLQYFLSLHSARRVYIYIPLDHPLIKHPNNNNNNNNNNGTFILQHSPTTLLLSTNG